MPTPDYATATEAELHMLAMWAKTPAICQAAQDELLRRAEADRLRAPGRDDDGAGLPAWDGEELPF
jgi:hypothetical protein